MPTNMNNIMQFIGMMKNGNPQQVVMNMLQERAQQGNPMFADIYDLAQKGDTKSIEGIVRNMAREKGIDFDKEFNSFRHTFGL